MNLFISVPFDIVLLKVLKCVIRTNIWSLLLVFLHPPSPEIHLCSEHMKVVYYVGSFQQERSGFHLFQN